MIGYSDQSRIAMFGNLARPLVTGIVFFVLVGFYLGNSVEQVLAYQLVVFAATLPSVLWIRKESAGIPIFPCISLAHLPYFGWPILSSSENLLDYSNSEISRAGITVALYLFAATITWRIAAGRRAHVGGAAVEEGFEASRIIQLMLLGLSVGIIFHISVISGALSWLGSFFGLIRSIAVTFATVACFLMGLTRAQGTLRNKWWVVALTGLGLMIILSWSSLFLVGGIIYALAAIFGYVIVAKRVPYIVVGMILVAVTVLHAGKGNMRQKYWEAGANFGGVASVIQVPQVAAEWIGEGIYVIATGAVEQSPLDRTGLLQMILRVQSETPNHIDYLMGETYALLPSILVPRFFDPDKPASQVGMDLLNIRYGILTAETAAVTAMGWGLIAEAYANFGDLGVIGIAMLIGFYCGMLQSWSVGAPTISLPNLTCIAAMMTLLSIEADFIQLFLTSLQTTASVFVFYAAFKSFAGRQYPPVRF